MSHEANSTPDTGRRKFLAQCGKFAVLTPPTITVLLSMTEQSFAHASSGGGGYGGSKDGNGHDHGGSYGGYKPPIGGSGHGGYTPGSYSHLTDDQKKKIAAA